MIIALLQNFSYTEMIIWGIIIGLIISAPVHLPIIIFAIWFMKKSSSSDKTDEQTELDEEDEDIRRDG